ncbi:hypothetical protein THARTR1_06570 [Trichoderma harzianum]|uniref:Monopolin complex subunit Csm1/Pcs1 C-terminal domain-containing protein n=1 Tax=Trichoderma harzianum TaxID=5544 RepID=A0A2K0U4M4_TRIHA|nr:hypothetical protein THARTR1_06570 [Trichoderma harzianum]
MRDRPAAANKVTKKTRNGPRGANAKARSAKRARKFNDELNDISPDSSVASEVDDEAGTLDQSKPSKQTRGRPKASKDREGINSSKGHLNEDADADGMRGLEDQGSNGDDIRRQFSELKKKYSKLEARYQELQELGAQAEENTRVANELIAQLKEEVAEQSKSIQRAEKVQVQLGQSETEADALRAQLAEANQSLSQAKSETKTLYTKLAASRQIEPNNKGSVPGNRAALAEKENKQVAQIKEDLYADLTGLIVRDVRRIDKEDVFDCIQTGRNGTLHFKLALENMDSADSYEDVQFAYRPQLDASRDGDLIEALPDYLTEEITFPRNQAPKFYARVIKSLMERLD